MNQRIFKRGYRATEKNKQQSSMELLFSRSEREQIIENERGYEGKESSRTTMLINCSGQRFEWCEEETDL